MYYEINEQTARIANDANSMRDYVKDSATNEYKTAVDAVAALVAGQKAKTSKYYHAKLDSLLDRYARRLAEWTNAYNRNEASCPSILVCGGGNFPVAKKNRQNSRRDTLWAEYNEIETIKQKIKSIGTGPVDLADPYAREILQEQLSSAQAELDECKAANAYYRKHKTLDGCPGITEAQKAHMTNPSMFACGSFLDLNKCPYPAYHLSSVRGKIKRVQARIEELDKRQNVAQSDAGTTQFDGGEIVRNAELNRLQILFDEKPDEELREKLKSYAFRWSPKNQAWQRQLTANAEQAAKLVLGL